MKQHDAACARQVLRDRSSIFRASRHPGFYEFELQEDSEGVNLERQSDEHVANHHNRKPEEQRRRSNFFFIAHKEDECVVNHGVGAVEQRAAASHDRHRDRRLHRRHVVPGQGVEAQHRGEQAQQPDFLPLHGWRDVVGFSGEK